ncbi:hypothetical protein EJB05_11139, partial [Eragrostis curvula]
MADVEDYCDFDDDLPSLYEMEEPRKLMFWERILAGLEALPESLVEKNVAVQGEAGWKKSELNQLGDLDGLLWKKKSAQLLEADEKRMMASASDETGLDKSDSLVQQAIEFRESWNSKWHDLYGRFDDVSVILPMRYTYIPAPSFARPCDALQIYSAKVAINRAGLQWPLHVFGMVAVRNSVDRTRNLVFYRRRDNCQTLAEKDPYLVLTGPTRPVVVTDPASDPVMIELDLKVKGAEESRFTKPPETGRFSPESEDRYLSFLAVPLTCSSGYGSCTFEYTSKHSTLELTVGEIGSSVEATIFFRVVAGSWPHGFRGQFSARTGNIDHGKLVLLDFGDHNVPLVNGDRYVNLSRQVVSVEVCGELKVSVEAWKDGCKVVEEEVAFTPERAGRSYGALCLGSCKMKVLVAWSLISPEPHPHVPDVGPCTYYMQAQ